MNADGSTLRTFRQPILVTGGCGFIGCNIVDALARRGTSVRILDSLARGGAKENAQWLQKRHRDLVSIQVADVRDQGAVESAIRGAAGIIHLAGQVAVTTSMEDPLADFDVNARGTLQVLEATRQYDPSIPLVFASTNKVYGRLLGDSDVVCSNERYAPLDPHLASGIGEAMPIDLYSPYGCSKGAADQYVRDYARVFGMRTAVLRMSCIYGPRQFGTEDQGWIAHFLLQAIRGLPITIYGDGYQVRDALHVDDAVNAWLRALDNIDAISGRIFNLGGGPSNSLSLRELLRHIERLRGTRVETAYADWRPGDQPWYVSDISTISDALGWSPSVSLPEGLESLNNWLQGRFGRGEVEAARAV